MALTKQAKLFFKIITKQTVLQPIFVGNRLQKSPKKHSSFTLFFRKRSHTQRQTAIITKPLNHLLSMVF